MAITAKLNITSDLKELSKVRKFVRDLFAQIPEIKENKSLMEKIELAVNEAAANIMKHAYEGLSGKEIQIVAEVTEHIIVIQLYDWGKKFFPESISSPKLDGSENGGFGIHIISNIVDNFVYSRNEAGRNATCLEIKLIDKEVT